MSKSPPDAVLSRGSESPNTLSSDVILEGEISTTGVLIFDGRLKGKILGATELIVGQNARIEGAVAAGSVTILGKVVGNVSAEERILAKSGAEIQGDLVSKRLSMEEGVVFVGSSKIAPR